MNTILKQNGLRFGLILGVALFIPSLIATYVDINFLTSNYRVLYVILIGVFLGLFCIGYAKKSLFGKISFKACFTTYFVMIFVSLIIKSTSNYIYFNYIDTDIVSKKALLDIDLLEEHRVKVLASDEYTEITKKRSMDHIDSNIKGLKEFDSNGYQISSIFGRSVKFLMVYLLFGLFLSLLLKTPQKKK